MQIRTINNSQNVSSKAKFYFTSEQYLLPKNAINSFEQKAKTIGSEVDKIHANIYRTAYFEEKVSKTPVIKDVVEISSQLSSKKTNNNVKIIAEGDIKKRQITAFSAINNYLEQLKLE